MSLKLLFFKQKHKLNEVFTPATSADISYIKRTSIERELKKNIGIPGKQIIVYGHSGGGKTTIVNYVLGQMKRKSISVSCLVSTTVDEIVLEAFDRLEDRKSVV